MQSNAAPRRRQCNQRGAEATGDAVKRGAEKTEEGAKKVGGAIKDVFTDDDKDSDKDGK